MQLFIFQKYCHNTQYFQNSFQKLLHFLKKYHYNAHFPSKKFFIKTPIFKKYNLSKKGTVIMAIFFRCVLKTFFHIFQNIPSKPNLPSVSKSSKLLASTRLRRTFVFFNLPDSAIAHSINQYQLVPS